MKSSPHLAKISEIRTEDPATWQNKIFLTFDIDWACDDVLNDTIDLVEKHHAAATWFVTHSTPVLERLRQNPSFELGIHPNFNNFMFNNSSENGASPREIVQKMKELVPEACSVRSHSMTQSSHLLEIFKENGLIFDCNTFVAHHSQIQLAPWKHWNGMTKVPYFWEDDVHFIESSKFEIIDVLRSRGLRVFDFHPIHVALNTRTVEDYESTRAHHRDFSKILSIRPSGRGSRQQLVELLQWEPS